MLGANGEAKGVIFVCVSQCLAVRVAEQSSLVEFSGFQWKMVQWQFFNHVITVDMRVDLDSCLHEESHLCDMI